ncbi:MAG: mechanosensitive ion channel [Chitinophagales bacterium]|nr:mechanosensitive ion channel [Chitinophagales bacterium]
MRIDKFLDYSLISIKNYDLTVSRLIAISIIIAFFYGLYRLIYWILGQRVKQNKLDFGSKKSIASLIKYFFWILAIIFSLQSLGINITILLAGSTALLVGLGLGLQQVFQDFVSGIVLLFDRSIKVDDIMEVNDIIGKVQSIGLRTSKLITIDGINIIVPNHKLTSDNVINWSHDLKASRFKVSVGVAYETDLEKAKKVLEDCLVEVSGILKNQEKYKNFVRVADFADSSIVFEVHFWTYNIFSIEQIKGELRFLIWRKFKTHNITFPFPQRDIYIKNYDAKNQ